MQRLTSISLLLACLTCWLIGCSREPANNRAEPARNAETPIADNPTEKPPTELPPADELASWLSLSPMRMKMRSMWVDCGSIVRFSASGGVVDFDWLEASGEDIARKAGAFADMWEIIRDQNRNMAAQAKKEDWFEARFASERVWSSCTDCHLETWSMHTRGFRQETIEGWLKDGYAGRNVPSADITLSAPSGYLKIMFSMLAHLERAISAMERHDVDGVLVSTQAIHKFVHEQVEFFRTIERHGRAIAEIASRNTIDGIQSQYISMTATCIQCHDKFVQQDRELMNPLPWKAPR
jgi:hypothetical protein